MGLDGCLPSQWVTSQEGTLSLENAPHYRSLSASLLFICREMLPYPSRLLTANTASRDVPDKEWSGPCILSIPNRYVGCEKSAEGCLSTVRRPGMHLASGSLNIFMDGEDIACILPMPPTTWPPPAHLA